MAKMTLTEQQQSVVYDRGGTLLVSAAAGSGKTKVLVDRVMEKILHEGKSIHEFLIITFTNAAAAELRGKISDAISAALADSPDNRHLSRQQNLLHLSQISTVHAFCGNLIRQYGYLLEVPSDYAMMEDPERDAMLSRLLDDLLEEKYAENSPDFMLLSDTFGPGRSDSGLIDLVISLFEKLLSQPYPRKWLEAQTVTLDDDQELTETIWGQILTADAKEKIGHQITRHQWAIEAMRGDEALEKKYVPAYETQLACLKNMLPVLDGPWDEIHENLIMTYPSASVRNYEDQEFLNIIKSVKEDCKETLKDVLQPFARSASELIAEQNAMAPALNALKALVLELYDRFSAEKRRKNLLDFSDQEHLAIRLLVDTAGRPTDVAREVSQRFTEIMVDEYQDSNRIQELIFTAISSSMDENRFLVGDVKQSIYGFRQAEPSIFIEKQNAYPFAGDAQRGAPRKLVLSKNFRSRPEILEAVNHVFKSVMTEDLGDITYDAHQQLYPGLEGYPADAQSHVELHVLELQKGTGDTEDEGTKYQREAAWVANRVAKLLKDRVPVRDGDTLRPARPEDIAILFRSKDPMNTYKKALEQRGIPVASGGGTDLFETPEVQVLLNLLRVIDNPHQDVPLLSVLCSPLFRFSNEQLSQIRIGSDKPRFYDALRESLLPSSVAAVKTLEEFRLRARNTSGEKLCWYLIHNTGLLSAYCAMEGGKAHRENLMSFYALCEKAAGGGHIYLYKLLRYLERAAESGVSASSEGASGVTFTTIHKSKGLEYPIVFLADLSRRFNFRDIYDPVIVDSSAGIGAKITDTKKRIRYPGLGHTALKCVKRKALLSEELRILYVAMTRPKDYLIMTYASANAASTIGKLLPGAGMPAQPWAAAGANCLGDWILLSALGRMECGELLTSSGLTGRTRTVMDLPWVIRRHTIEGNLPMEMYQRESQKEDVDVPSPQMLSSLLSWTDPHSAAARTPSKLTATQLKGRSKDSEAAEHAPAAKQAPQLRRPDFIHQNKGLTPTEKGTAAHLFLQYADYPKCTNTDDLMEELDRMVDDEFLTKLQAASIDPEVIIRLFQSDIGKSLLSARELIREFKFSILTDAAEFYPDVKGEEVLLQGVVDAAIVEEDGITVVDFKTDRVTEATVRFRADQYRPQLETYKKALRRIWKKDVKKTVLYFLRAGLEVDL